MGTERRKGPGGVCVDGGPAVREREEADLSLSPPFLGPPFLKTSLGCLLEAGAVHREAPADE